jgi:hypothetical protein
VLVQDDGARSEELAFGPDSRGRRWPRIVLAGIVVIASAAAGVDARQRADEAAALVAGIEQSQATMVYAERSVIAIVRYASPALVLSKTPEAVRQDLVQLIEDQAADGAASIQVARGNIAAVRLWPWHDDLEVARTAYLDYLDYRTARLVAGAAGSGTTTEFAAHADGLLREARDALRSALDDDDAAGISELLVR